MCVYTYKRKRVFAVEITFGVFLFFQPLTKKIMCIYGGLLCSARMGVHTNWKKKKTCVNPQNLLNKTEDGLVLKSYNKKKLFSKVIFDTGNPFKYSLKPGLICTKFRFEKVICELGVLKWCVKWSYGHVVGLLWLWKYEM